MANASNFVMVGGAPSTVTTPAAGSFAYGLDANGKPYVLDSALNVWQPLQTSLTAATGAITNTETVINTLTVPVGVLQAGTIVRWTFSGTCTPTVGNATTFTFRAGTAGTTSDQSVATWVTAASGTSGTTNFAGELEFTVRTVGATGTGEGWLALSNNSASTGIITVLSSTLISAGTNLATTTATKLSFTCVAAAATTSSTFQTGSIVIVPK